MNIKSRTQVRETIELLCFACYETACEKGWWQKEREIPQLLALVHSEVSEALEAWRNAEEYGKLPSVTPFEEELADILIRVFDMSEHFGFNLATALLAKMDYNKTRSFRHGGKRA
jgi:NTP pyrophosphatase (non-canonical NTP hydrolase)